MTPLLKVKRKIKNVAGSVSVLRIGKAPQLARTVRWLLGFVLITFSVGQAGAPSMAQTQPRAVHDAPRHALIIGTGTYERARDLPNASRDADDLAMRFGALGFDVYGGRALIDLDRDAMLAAMRGFARDVPDGALALVYVAGHGLSDGGDSYLGPTDDAALMTRADLSARAVALRALTGRLAARRGVTALLFIDACRANPLAGMQDSSGAGGTGDLVAGNDGAMTLMYAAAPGQIAADRSVDPGVDHSPFATAILAGLEGPGQPLDALLAKIARGTREASGGFQTPWTLRTYASDRYDVVIAPPGER